MTKTAAPLTDRQESVLHLLTEGLSGKEIGDELGISHSAVKQHVAAIRRKAGVAHSRQLVRWAKGRV